MLSKTQKKQNAHFKQVLALLQKLGETLELKESRLIKDIIDFL